jgi:hypothetical protein
MAPVTYVTLLLLQAPLLLVLSLDLLADAPHLILPLYLVGRVAVIPETSKHKHMKPCFPHLIINMLNLL